MSAVKVALIAGVLLGQMTLIVLALFTSVVDDIDAALVACILMLFLAAVLPALTIKKGKGR